MQNKAGGKARQTSPNPLDNVGGEHPMPLCIPNRNSEGERALQTKVYDLQSLSAALRMQKPFAKEVKLLIPLLEQCAGAEIAAEFRRRFGALMEEYELLGMPTSLLNDDERAYLDKVRDFSRGLLDYVESHLPIEVALAP